MRLVVMFALLVFLLTRAKAQDQGPTTFKELYEQRLGITLSSLEEEALDKWYPKDTWQRARIFAEFTDENLTALLTWQYNFQASTPQELDRKQGLVTDYLQRIGFLELMEELGNEEPITETPLEALRQGKLSELDTEGCLVVIDDDQPIRVRPESVDLVEELVKMIRDSDLCEYARTTGSFRPVIQTLELGAFGFPAPAEITGTHPASVGRSITLALEGTPAEGPYARFLESISLEEEQIIRDHISDGAYPTISNLLDWGITLDPEFMKFWELLLESGFVIMDLTGFQSVTAGPNTIDLWRVNPVFVLVDVR
jgi:hypothetical protein